MTPWAKLVGDHQSVLAVGGKDMKVVRQRFKALSAGRHADGTLSSRFSYKAMGNRLVWSISPAYGASATDRWSEPLSNLRPDITDARLSFLAMTSGRKNERLEDLSIMLAGSPKNGRPWVVAAHFKDKPDGDGACSHALLHCHVGPTLDDAPKVRVPLPVLTPVAILDWVLTVAVPGWEPAPWDKLSSAAGST